MAILRVSDVRRHLYWAAGGPPAAGTGAASNALLGRIFHDLYAQLASDDPKRNLVKPLELADASVESWRKVLTEHAFTTAISPALAQHELALHGMGAQVLDFWTAVRELCAWLADLMHAQREASGGTTSIALLHQQIFAGAEVEVQAEFSDPAWPEPILLQGRADALLARPTDHRYCVLELKLGRSHPEADLLQGCMYHMMLAQRDAAQANAALGIVCFQPQPHEMVLEAAQLQHAQQALMAVLAELAGFGQSRPVDHGTKSAPPGAAVIAPVAPAVLDQMRQKLAAAFSEYGAPLTIASEAACGPAFVRFLAAPRRGVSVSRVARLADNVWMRLNTAKPPQVTLQHGRIAIDVERPDRQRVDFAQWKDQPPGRSAGGSARFAVGVTVDGSLHTADLSASQSPHVLVVGTTGSGKSEWLRAFLASLMAANTAQTLRFALIDPKRLAFTSLEKSPFLWQPIVYDEAVIELLDRLIEEMEHRYGQLQTTGADDLASFNVLQRGRSGATLPRLVCVCDEFADLLLRDKNSRKAIEERVARLGAKGRAAGVHLVFATQRAGREVLKGAIDSNLPARVAMSVPRAVDSQLVLGEKGAEALLGKGDLLYKDIGAPIRLQGLFVTREELGALAGCAA